MRKKSVFRWENICFSIRSSLKIFLLSVLELEKSGSGSSDHCLRLSTKATYLNLCWRYNQIDNLAYHTTCRKFPIHSISTFYVYLKISPFHLPLVYSLIFFCITWTQIYTNIHDIYKQIRELDYYNYSRINKDWTLLYTISKWDDTKIISTFN